MIANFNPLLFSSKLRLGLLQGDAEGPCWVFVDETKWTQLAEVSLPSKGRHGKRLAVHAIRCNTDQIQAFQKSTLESIFSDICIRPCQQRFSLLDNCNPMNPVIAIWILFKHRNSSTEQPSSEMWSKCVASTAKLFSVSGNRAVTQTLLFFHKNKSMSTEFHGFSRNKLKKKWGKDGKDIVLPNDKSDSHETEQHLS